MIWSKVIWSKNPRSKFFGCTGVSHPWRRGVREVHLAHVFGVRSIATMRACDKNEKILSQNGTEPHSQCYLIWLWWIWKERRSRSENFFQVLWVHGCQSPSEEGCTLRTLDTLLYVYFAYDIKFLRLYLTQTARDLMSRPVVQIDQSKMIRST